MHNVYSYRQIMFLFTFRFGIIVNYQGVEILRITQDIILCMFLSTIPSKREYVQRGLLYQYLLDLLPIVVSDFISYIQLSYVDACILWLRIYTCSEDMHVYTHAYVLIVMVMTCIQLASYTLACHKIALISYASYIDQHNNLKQLAAD